MFFYKSRVWSLEYVCNNADQRSCDSQAHDVTLPCSFPVLILQCNCQDYISALQLVLEIDDKLSFNVNIQG